MGPSMFLAVQRLPTILAHGLEGLSWAVLLGARFALVSGVPLSMGERDSGGTVLQKGHQLCPEGANRDRPENSYIPGWSWPVG